MRTLLTALLFDDELPVKNKPLVVDDEPPALVDEPPALVDEPPVENEKPLSGLEIRFYLPFYWLVAELRITGPFQAVDVLLILVHSIFYVGLPIALIGSIIAHLFVLLARFTPRLGHRGLGYMEHHGPHG